MDTTFQPEFQSSKVNSLHWSSHHFQFGAGFFHSFRCSAAIRAFRKLSQMPANGRQFHYVVSRVYIPKPIHTSGVWQLACWGSFSVCLVKIGEPALMHTCDCVGLFHCGDLAASPVRTPSGKPGLGVWSEKPGGISSFCSVWR